MRNALPGEPSLTPVTTANSRTTDLKRRRFLFTLGAGGAGAAVAAASTLPGVAAAQVAAAPATAEDSGYRETAHVRDYYRTAKI